MMTRFRLLVPGLLALGGAMKKIESYLTVEVAQRLHDMQEGRKEIPVRWKQSFYRTMANIA